MSDGKTFLSGISAIIYDLDGTLYEDTHHFDHYAGLLAAAVAADRRAAFRSDYAAAKAGAHTLRIGRLYDLRHDLVLTGVGGEVLTAQRWDGAVLPEAVRRRLYPGPVAVDHGTLMNVGDLWWVPAALAAHYGVGAETRQQAFLATRDFMSGPEFQVSPIPGLRAAMLRLRERGVKQVLATNSPQPDTATLVRKSGLEGLLDRLYYQCNKPAGFPAVVQGICRECGLVPAQVLSVGDNYLNDLAPARDLGLRTAFIDPHDTGEGLPCNLRVHRMGELLPHLCASDNPGA